MKILIAPDSFKNCLSSQKICEIFRKNCINDVITCPMADGGEGTVNTLVNATNGRYITKSVHGPNYNKVYATYGILGDKKTAVIEVASCAGIALVKKRNPFYTTTYGLGELILDALDKGIRDFIIGLGGSSTNDAGIGMLRALGIKMYSTDKTEIIHAKDICKIFEIDRTHFDKRIKESNFLIASDVTNPFTGINGASFVFGPQKGATKSMAKKLDDNFKHFEKILGRNLEFKGAGAAGGLGACFVVFFDANLEKGIDIVNRICKLEEKIQDADIVITGEGRSDSQTKFGKTPYGILCLAKKYNKPVYLFSGRIIDSEELLDLGFDKLVEISPKDVTMSYAIRNTKRFLIETIKCIGI